VENTGRALRVGLTGTRYVSSPPRSAICAPSGGDEGGQVVLQRPRSPKTRLAYICNYRHSTYCGGENRRMIVIEELRAQIDAVRDKLALAEQAGLSYEAILHRARLADLMDIASRHAIDLTAPGKTPAGTRLGPAGAGIRHEPVTDALAGADVHSHADLTTP
jgi:hypothetical protein